jgi:hypothetical protein
MKRLNFTLRVVTFAIFSIAFASIAQAQATRTWVSGVGDDVNPCSRTAPCKTFAGAISKTAAKGEIDCLDPGGFGAVTITKSITIDGTYGAGFGGILASLTNGVIVNDGATATPNTSIVHLRNLSIDGAGNGTDGIRFLSARELYVESCVVWGFGSSATSDGLDIAPTTGTLFNITVRDSIFKDNSGDGIRQSTSIGTLNASYDNVTLTGNTNGLEATGGTGSISNSTIDDNATSGIQVSGGAIVNANNNEVTNNGTSGINNASPSTVRINGNNIHRNGTGLNGNGTYQSFNNNKVIGNTTADVGGATVITNVVATNQK